MERCLHCGFEFEGTPACPSCGRENGPKKNQIAAQVVIVRYFKDIAEILFRPGYFFRRMPITGGIRGPLAFALLTHWLGSALGYLARSLFSPLDFYRRVSQFGGSDSMYEGVRDRILNWFFGAGSIILDPFLTLISIFFTTFFVWMGARLLVKPHSNGAPDEISFESSLRIVCFAMSPSILSAVPLLGGIISTLWITVATIIGAREVYRVKTGRATVVALFPQILMYGIFLFVIVTLGVLAFKFFGALMH